MRLTGVYAENFMRIGPAGLFFDFAEHPLVCALGANESGKSSLLRELILWVQEGKTSKGLTASPPETSEDTVVNRFGPGTCLGENFYRAPDGDLWIARRFVATKGDKTAKLRVYTVPASYAAAGATTLRERFLAYVAENPDQAEQTDAARSDAQAMVTALAGNSNDILQQQAFLSRWGRPLAGMSPAERQEAFDEITGAAGLSRTREKMKKTRVKTAQAAHDAAKAQVDVLTGQEEIQASSLARLEAAVREREEQARARAAKMRTDNAKRRAEIEEEEDRLVNESSTETARAAVVAAKEQALATAGEELRAADEALFSARAAASDATALPAAEAALVAARAAADALPSVTADVEKFRALVTEAEEVSRQAQQALEAALIGLSAKEAAESLRLKLALERREHADAASAAASAAEHEAGVAAAAANLDVAGPRLSELSAALQAWQAERSGSREALIREHASAYADHRAAVAALEALVDPSAAVGTCPTCEQEVTGEHLALVHERKEVDRAGARTLVELRRRAVVDFEAALAAHDAESRRLQAEKNLEIASAGKTVGDIGAVLDRERAALAAARAAASTADLRATIIVRLEAELATLEEAERAGAEHAARRAAAEEATSSVLTGRGYLRAAEDHLRDRQIAVTSIPRLEADVMRLRAAAATASNVPALQAAVDQHRRAVAEAGLLLEEARVQHRAAVACREALRALIPRKLATDAEDIAIELGLEDELDQCGRDDLTAATLAHAETRAKLAAERAVVAAKAEELADYTYLDKLFGPSGLPNELTEEALPFLNERVARYIEALCDRPVEVTFSATAALKNGEKRDRFTVLIENSSGARGVKGQSDGAGDRIDHAIALAIGDLVGALTGNSIGVRVLDEPSKGLDAAGEEAMVRLIRQLANDEETIVVITHSERIANMLMEVPRALFDRDENEHTRWRWASEQAAVAA